MNEQNYFRVSVKGIVIKDNKILLARESSGLWEILGGGLEHEEDPIDGLKREIYEETGLKITKVSAQPKYFFTTKRLGKESYVANVVYEIELENLEFTPTDECQELKFFSVDEISGIDAFPNVKKFYEILKTERDHGQR